MKSEKWRDRIGELRTCGNCNKKKPFNFNWRMNSQRIVFCESCVKKHWQEELFVGV